MHFEFVQVYIFELKILVQCSLHFQTDCLVLGHCTHSTASSSLSYPKLRGSSTVCFSGLIEKTSSTDKLVVHTFKCINNTSLRTVRILFEMYRGGDASK